tara:strand:+ start:286 stop:945 length:660 start_codon:yes stop_codon:yes gene_type:complete
MNLRNTTAWLLILGPILLLVGGLVFGPGVNSADEWKDTAGLLKALGENNSLQGISAIVTSLGVIGILIAFIGIKDSMKGNTSECYMKCGILIFLLSMPGQAAEQGLHAAAAEAAALPGGAGMATGATLIATASGIGAISTVIFFIGIALIGIAILIQKNYLAVSALNIIVGIAFTAAGVLGIIAIAGIDYISTLTFVSWTLFIATTLLTGIFTLVLKKK